MLAQFARSLEAADATAVMETMSSDVTLHVAVHQAPFRGHSASRHVLAAVLDGALYDINVGEVIEGPVSAVLMFSTCVAGYRARADGLLVIRSDVHRGNKISELTVYLRPLPALAALADEMGRRLGGARPEGTQ